MRYILALFTAVVGAQTLPFVPGKINPAVTQANIQTTICAGGWTKHVRPPASYTNSLKRQQIIMFDLRVDLSRLRDWEEDHRVPLEVGGDPRSPQNLWPEPWHGPFNAHQKDRLENAVKRDVCAGRLTLDQGQAIFLGNFWDEYKRRFVGVSLEAGRQR